MSKAVIKKTYVRDDIILNINVSSKTNFDIQYKNAVIARLHVVFKQLSSERFFVKTPGCYCEFTNVILTKEILIDAMKLLQEFLNENDLEYRGTLTKVFPEKYSAYHSKNGFKAIQFKLPKRLQGEFLLLNDNGKIRLVSYEQFKKLSELLDGKVEIIALDDFIFAPSKKDVAFVSFSNITQKGNENYFSSNSHDALYIEEKESMKNITVIPSLTGTYVLIHKINNDIIEKERRIFFPKFKYPQAISGDLVVKYKFDKCLEHDKIKFNLQLKDYEGVGRIIISLPRAKITEIDYLYEIARNVNRKGIYISVDIIESAIRGKFKFSSETKFNDNAIAGTEFYKFINDIKKERKLDFMRKKYAFFVGLLTRPELEAKKRGVSLDVVNEEKRKLAKERREESKKNKIIREKKIVISVRIMKVVSADWKFVETIFNTDRDICLEILKRVDVRGTTVNLLRNKGGYKTVSNNVDTRIDIRAEKFIDINEKEITKEESDKFFHDMFSKCYIAKVLRDFRKAYEEEFGTQETPLEEPH